MGPDLLAVTPAHSELRGQLPQTPRSRLIGFQHLHTQIIRIRLCHRLVFAKIAKPTMTALPFPAYNYCDSALVDIGRQYGRPPPEPNRSVVWLKTTITSDKSRRRR